MTQDSGSDELSQNLLAAVHDAALAVTAELSLPKVLDRIVNLARELVNARYAALAVPNPEGGLEQFLVAGLSDAEIHRVAHAPVGEGLLGLLLEPDAEPIRIPEIAQHPASIGMVEGHPQMTSFLGVPIISRGELLGSLYLADRIDAVEFSEIDQRQIELLASHAAVAIENARLYEQVQRLAVLEERERIGMDLHDGIIQSIYAVGLLLEYSVALLDEDLPNAKQQLNNAIEGLNATIKDIRNYILDLRPQKFQGDDLRGALRNLLTEFRANTLSEIELDFAPSVNQYLNQETASAAFHIVQEALANASKHSAATLLVVSIRMEDDQIVLFVRDNGRGFQTSDTEPVIGHGLSNMTLRARAVGGHIEIESEVKQGSTVRVYLPGVERAEK